MKLVKFAVLLTVVLIPLIVASKKGEFKYDCFVNHKNHKGKCELNSNILL